MQTFNVTLINKSLYTVKTEYNSYLVKVDEIKGIGIYLEYEGGNSLIKTYKHTKMDIAIAYLFKTNIF